MNLEFLYSLSIEKYGLNNHVLDPPFSFLISILLLLGFDYQGLRLTKLFYIREIPKWLRYQIPIISVSFFCFIFFLMSLLGYFSRPVAFIFAFIILVSGLASVILNIKEIKIQLQIFKFGHENLLIFILFGCFFIISASPITEVDALDYNVGVAIEILNTGAFPAKPEWFHSRLSGSGALTTAIGLSVGAEQFGSIVQFSGLLAIFGILKHYPLFLNQRNIRNFIIISFLSTPVLIPWIATSKPFLLPVAMTSLAFILVNYLEHCREKKYHLAIFILISFLLMIASTMKLSFLISSFFIGIWALFISFKKKFIIKSLLFGGLIFAITILPFQIWKYINFGGSLFDIILNPFPGTWPGISQFLKGLQDYKEGSLFPFNLIIPNTFGNLTTIIGFSIIIWIFILLKNFKNVDKRLMLLVFTTFISIFIFGQSSARFFLEPYVWILFTCLLIKNTEIKLLISLKSIILLQTAITIIFSLIGVINLAPGIFSNTLREKVMTNNTDGYAEMQWADKMLPKNAIIFSDMRHLGLSPRHTISSDWVGLSYSDKNIYKKIVENQKPDFRIVRGNFEDSPKLLCGETIHAGPKKIYKARRNPLNRSSFHYVWILKLNNHKICF